MAAAKFHLDNPCAVVDVNGLQIDGKTADVMPSEPLDKKFEAFGWHVIKVNGHDYEALENAFAEAAATKDQPTVLLAATVKGKGVSFMENNAGWHGKAPDDEQYKAAMGELLGVLKGYGVEWAGQKWDQLKTVAAGLKDKAGDVLEKANDLLDKINTLLNGEGK